VDGQGGIVNTRLARLLVVLVFTVGLTASVLLPLNSEYQQGLAAAGAQAARPVALNVALVNEDRGAEAGGEQVNLGRAYVRQIERDTSAVWRVVSRGVAESGLAQGSYHVLVLIPAEFSAKLLDLEAEDPGPIGVTYQVNGNGNARVETVADARARGIVGQLNGQLVDMYVASILGNLRQAQENVRFVADAEAGHVGVLVDEVDPAARAIGTSLSVLAQGSDGSVTEHLGLVDGLDGLGGDVRSGVEGATARRLPIRSPVRSRGRCADVRRLPGVLAGGRRAVAQRRGAGHVRRAGRDVRIAARPAGRGRRWQPHDGGGAGPRAHGRVGGLGR